MKDKAQSLREQIEAKPILRIMGAHNGLGAQLIERNSFDGVWASGLEISTAHVVPDANILTMTENLDVAQAINDATRLPVICDCDTGYGNAANVVHMVKKYESAGLAAAVIEDKRFPKVNSFIPGRQELAPISEFMGKIEAAKSAQRRPDFMVIARIEALIAGWGMDEAVKRAHAYEEAGADGLVIHSKKETPDEIFEFAQRFKGKIPLVAIPTTYYNVTAEELARRGFKVVIYANHGLRAAIKAMNETFSEIQKTGSTASVENKIVSMKSVFEIQGMLKLKELEEKFHKVDGIRVFIPAAGEPSVSGEFAKMLGQKPLCMLPVGGKPLLQHQIELFRSANSSEVFVIGGYAHEKLEVGEAKVLFNPRYKETHIVESLMTARKHFQGKCVISYSDILFDRQILDQVLTSPHPITLVIDRAYQGLPYRDKKLDLVQVEDPAEGETRRRMNLNTIKPIRKIGKKLTRDTAQCEFVGIAYLQEEGHRMMFEAWETAKKQFSGKPFYEAASVETASLNDLFQFMIDQGIPVYGLEIEHGWSELHSAEDFNRLNDYFKMSQAMPSVI